jgi:hypothetical protein
VNEQGIERKRLFGENAGRGCVDGHGKIWLGFGTINGSVGGGIQNHSRLNAANQGTGLCFIRKIDGFKIDRNDGTQVGKTALEFYAYLPGSADNEKARLFCHVRKAPVCSV